MFIYHVKLNKTILTKLFFGLIAIAIIVLFGLVVYTIFRGSMRVKLQDNIRRDSPNVITAENYTNILKAVHDNPEEYIGKEVQFSGYIYRVSDFSKEEFVLARDMIISSDLQTLVVGFLCKSKEALYFSDKTWVEITGKIQKGTYHSEIPIIVVSKIMQTAKPKDVYVYPPDDYYVPTSVIF